MKMEELPKFEVEIDIKNMSQDEINRLVVNTLVAMNKKLDPIVNTYNTGATIGKWIMAAAIGITVLVGAFYSLLQIFQKK